MAVAVLMLLTDTGVFWMRESGLVDPLPNSPFFPSPQHLTVPPESTAQVWLYPAATAVAVLMLLPAILAGTVLLSWVDVQKGRRVAEDEDSRVAGREQTSLSPSLDA